MFPDEAAARQWFEETRWPGGERYCPHCGSMDRVQRVPKDKPMPYRCGDCRKYFSVRTGTVMERSHIPLHKWVVGLHLMVTNLKGVSSMKLHRDLGIRQSSAWFMAHRIRKSWEEGYGLFNGPVEVDETYIGGKESNKHARRKAHAGRGPVGKIPVVGVRDRETNRVSAAVVQGRRRCDVAPVCSRSDQARCPSLHRRKSSLPKGSETRVTKPCSIARVSTAGAWRTPTGSRASGPCSNVPIREPTTR